MRDNPTVSVIIPCRNEEKFIGKCLDSIIEQDYPKDKTEILVVDGVSGDGIRKIIENCGLDYTEIVSKMPNGQGYDARNDKYADMLEADIIDPTKVERVSLENAVSNASMLITTFAIISDYQEPKK